MADRLWMAGDQYLWASSVEDGSVDPDTEFTGYSWWTNIGDQAGVAYDGTDLWLIEIPAPFSGDPVRFVRVSAETGAELGALEFPGAGSNASNLTSLVYADGAFWVTDRSNTLFPSEGVSTGMVWKVDASDGSLLDFFPAPEATNAAVAVTYGDGHLWVFDDGTFTLWKMDPSDGSNVESWDTTTFGDSGLRDIVGMAYQDGHVWMNDTGVRKAVKIDLASSAVASEFATDTSPDYDNHWPVSGLALDADEPEVVTEYRPMRLMQRTSQQATSEWQFIRGEG